MELLLRAEESDDLGEAQDGTLGDVDVLRAAGMATHVETGAEHNLALQLWRLTILGERRTLSGVVLMLMDLAGRLGIEHPEEAVCSVIEWMMAPTCHPCKGRGLMPIEGVEHVLSDNVCEHCHGSGHRPTGFSEGARTLYAKIQDMQSYAATAIARKLRS